MSAPIHAPELIATAPEIVNSIASSALASFSEFIKDINMVANGAFQLLSEIAINSSIIIKDFSIASWGISKRVTFYSGTKIASFSIAAGKTISLWASKFGSFSMKCLSKTGVVLKAWSKVALREGSIFAVKAMKATRVWAINAKQFIAFYAVLGYFAAKAFVLAYPTQIIAATVAGSVGLALGIALTILICSEKE